jgi:hypothetical protein
MRLLAVIFVLPLLGALHPRQEMPLRIVENPTFRIEEMKSFDMKLGFLVFETLLENISDDYVSGGVTFSSYLQDGTKHEECSTFSGPGDYFTVAPREKVRVQCRGQDVPVDIRLKVTMRLHEVRAYTLTQSLRVTASEQGVRLIEKNDNSNNYEVWALLQSISGDAKVRYAFRLYDEDGIQIAEYQDLIVKSVEPEVKRRVEWGTLISRESKQPVSVRTHVFDVLESAEGSEAPTDLEYGRLIQNILSRKYNPPSQNDASGVQYVVVQLRIARDGRILSLVNGRVAKSYFKRRCANVLINHAAERAVIASDPLPPFPKGFLIGAQEAVTEIWFRYPK